VHQVGSFVSGLKENIMTEVQAAKPTTLNAVVGLSRLYEARILAQGKASFDSEPKPYQPQGWNQPLNPPFVRNSTPVIKRLTDAEMKDRRERGLCFNCEEKFRPGHHCMKLFLIEGIYPGEDENDEAKPTVEERNLMADGDYG